MKLFYKPGACSLASHMVLREIGAKFELISVDTDAGVTEFGDNYLAVNPRGYVPALQLDDGEVVTEGAAVLQFIAEQADSNLIPPAGTMARTRLQEFLNYTSSEVHKAFSPLFSSNATEAEQLNATNNVRRKFNHLETVLSDGRQYLLGKDFSVADAYMAVVCNWAQFKNIDISLWPHIASFVDRVLSRPTARAAMMAEGLIAE